MSRPELRRPPVARVLVALAVLALPVAVALLAFGPALDNGFVNYDDPRTILEDEAIAGPGEGRFARVLTERHLEAWLPVWRASYWIDHAISGREPWGYHLVSILWHGLTASLLVLLLRRAGGALLPALSAGLLFAAHPVVTESVVWASSRKDLVSTALLILALIALQGGLGARFGAERETRGGSSRVLFGATLAAALQLLAMFAKATALVTPLLAWPLVRLGESRGTVTAARSAARLAPLGILGAALLGTAVHLAVALEEGTAELGGASLPLRALGMLGVLGAYARLLVLPSGLTVHHDRPFDGSFGGDHVLGVLALVLLAAAARLFLRRPGFVTFGILWAGLSLVPFNNLLPRFSIAMAERYLYVGAAGAACAAAFACHRLLRGGRGLPALLVVGVLVAVGILLARDRSRDWADSETLWRAAIARAPEASLPRIQLGTALEERAVTASREEATLLVADAVANYRAALDRARGPLESVRARLKLGPALVLEGRPAAALEVFEALDAELRRGDVDLPPGDRDGLRVSRASALAALGRTEEAARELERVGAASPLRIEARNQLAVVEMLAGRRALEEAGSDAARAEAARRIDRALEIYRDLAERRPRRERSRVEYVRALLEAPWIPDHGIVVAREARALVDDFPESAEARVLRARAWAPADPEAAIADLKVATRLDPEIEEAWLLLAELLRSRGRNKEAVAALELGRRALPDSERLRSAAGVQLLAFAFHHRNVGELGLALEATSRVLDLLPGDAETLVLRAEVLAALAGEKGQPTTIAEERFAEAASLLEGVLEKDPGDLRARSALAGILRARGFRFWFQEAAGAADEEAADGWRDRGMDDFLRARRLDPEGERAASADRLMRLHAGRCRDRARQAYEVGDDRRAVAQAERATLFEPEEPDHHALLAKTLFRAGREEEAIGAWERALALDPGHLEALYELGTARVERLEWRAAAETLERFLRAADRQEVADLLGPQMEAARRLAETCRRRLEDRDG